MSYNNSQNNQYSFFQYNDSSCINERALYELFFPNLQYNQPHFANFQDTEKLLFSFNKTKPTTTQVNVDESN
jgi:hypothetical protein